MQIKEYKVSKNELGGWHIQETIKEVPDPVDYPKETHNKLVALKNNLADRLTDLKERQRKIAQKVGVTE